METLFTRGTKDPVEVFGLTGAADVLPDGRFVVCATANDKQQRKGEFSLVRGRRLGFRGIIALTSAQMYIEDKKKTAVTDEDAVMFADRKTVLLEAQRSLISLVQFWKLWCVCSSQTECDHPCAAAAHILSLPVPKTLKSCASRQYTQSGPRCDCCFF